MLAINFAALNYQDERWIRNILFRSLIYPHIMSIIQSMGRGCYIDVLIAETFNSFLMDAQVLIEYK